ncbi:hypothetical protein AALP_AAs47492U000300 [Arabis alpina]|uniref:Uncharacterized protein n=1 Tax=Arabis alpina TaxID=50452 RepID=A0A087FWT7_ARAAL|nr:hypothetical protein AALP_AAs47492U000300 [Arabis alpina]
MAKRNQPDLRPAFLLLVVLLVSSSIDHAIASLQELLPLTGWREKLIQVKPSWSRRGHGYYVGFPAPPPPSQSPPPSLAPSSVSLSSR